MKKAIEAALPRRDQKACGVSDIRHIVFDLGQVLIAYDAEAPFRELIPDKEERARFLRRGVHLRLEPRAGPRAGAGARARTCSSPAIRTRPTSSAPSARAGWEMIPGPIETNVAIVGDLIDRGLDVTALTNWAPDTFTDAEEKFPILKRFRGVTVSGRVGLVKPRPRSTRHHAETFGLDPARTLFFDDNPVNVEAARNIGWQAEQYVSTDTLQSDLRRYGLAP